MEGSYANGLKLWQGPQSTVVQDLFGPPGDELIKGHIGASGSPPEQIAARLFACEALHTPTDLRRHNSSGEPYTLQWFLNIENQRHGRHARWIPRLLEFTKHSGEKLLGLGHGLGTDWIQYARNGASVVVCSSCQSQLEIISRNFQLRGLEGQFVHAAPDCLPLPNCSIDVACISGLLQQVEHPVTIVNEIFRVLKPGGKVIAVTPAKYDVDYWKDWLYIWQRLWGKRRRDGDEVRRRFSARRLSRLFHGFEEHRIKKRQLRRSEVPNLWRWLPRSALERLLGRVLVLKAFKPVSTALPVKAAA